MNCKKIHLIILAIMTAAGMAYTQQVQDTVQTDTADTLADKADGANTEAQNVNHDSSAIPEASQASSEADTPSAKAAVTDTGEKSHLKTEDEKPAFLLKANEDTILLIEKDSDVHKILHNVSVSVKKSRIQGYGGAGGFSHRLVFFDMDPVVDLVQNDSKLAGVDFPSLGGGYKGFTMSGGMGYGGLGKGIRIGGGGYGGSCKHISAPFTRENAAGDSTVALKTSVSYGGLLIEKAHVKENWNIYMGGFIGGGGVKIEKITSPAGKASAFTDSWFDGRDGERANASFMAMELHGGATYTIVSWMHLGGDFNALFYYSSSGFGLSSGNSFYGITPGFGIRVVFGNIG